MRQIRPDLWETEPYSPFEGLTTHAYLWTASSSGNVLIYSPGGKADLDEIDRLGGVAHHYLSHEHEAGPMLRVVGQRFGSLLHVPAAEVDTIARFATADIVFDHRHIDGAGIEVIPSPGRSPGSTCFVVPGHAGATYLFTGDTIYRGTDGRWHAACLPGISDAAALAASLGLLATLEPDLVASCAFPGDAGVHPIAARSWPSLVAEARSTLPN